MKHLQTSLRWGTEMLREERKRIIAGKLDLDYKEISVRAVVDFIKVNLNDFAVQYSHIEHENSLTQKLVTLLMQRLPQPALFYFHSQYLENIDSGNSSSVDIGVLSSVEKVIQVETIKYNHDEAFFKIEAKRLDSSIEKRREKEYVVGHDENKKYKNSGGIERFKKKKHGDSLNFAAMIGYMQTDTFSIWLNKVNGWIDEQIAAPSSTDLKWDVQDKLVKQNESDMWSEYTSKHSRLKSDDIILFHLWVNLTIINK